MERLILAIHLNLISLLRIIMIIIKKIRHKPGLRRKESLSKYLIAAGIIFTYLVSLFYILFPAEFLSFQLKPVFILQILGIIALCLNTGLLTITQIQLGKLWSGQLELNQQHKLITGGLYGFSRHPMYLSVFCWIAGVILVTQNLIFLITLLLPLGLILRVKQEEQLLEEHFGEQYRVYKLKTRMFL